MKDVQYHPVSDEILHVDFLQIFEDKPVVISVPVNYSGIAKGVLKGGRLVRKYRKLKIKAFLKHLPDEIVVDITNLNVNDSRKVMDLKLDNVEFLDSPSSIVVAVKSVRTVVEEEEEVAEEGAEAKATDAPDAPEAAN